MSVISKLACDSRFFISSVRFLRRGLIGETGTGRYSASSTPSLIIRRRFAGRQTPFSPATGKWAKMYYAKTVKQLNEHG
jgi:hypothetical protein